MIYTLVLSGNLLEREMDSEKNMVITLVENTRGFKGCMYRPVQ